MMLAGAAREDSLRSAWEERVTVLLAQAARWRVVREVKERVWQGRRFLIVRAGVRRLPRTDMVRERENGEQSEEERGVRASVRRPGATPLENTVLIMVSNATE